MARNTHSSGSSDDNINYQSDEDTSNSNSNNESSSNDSGNGSGSNSESRLCCLGYVDYIILASTLAIAIGEELNATDLNILASFAATLSDELALVAAIKQCESGSDDDVVVAPIPPSVVAMTRANMLKTNKNTFMPKTKRTKVKKIIKKRVKKK